MTMAVTLTRANTLSVPRSFQRGVWAFPLYIAAHDFWKTTYPFGGWLRKGRRDAKLRRNRAKFGQHRARHGRSLTDFTDLHRSSPGQHRTSIVVCPTSVERPRTTFGRLRPDSFKLGRVRSKFDRSRPIAVRFRPGSPRVQPNLHKRGSVSHLYPTSAKLGLTSIGEFCQHRYGSGRF